MYMYVCPQMNVGFRNAPSARVTGQDEDAAALRFGPEFDPASTVFAALDYQSVCDILALREENARNTSIPPEKRHPPVMKDNMVFAAAKRHANRFDMIKKPEQSISIRRMIISEKDESGEPRFHPFEVVQIMNLMPADAEEARALIPSLEKKTDLGDDVLNRLLDSIRTLL